MELNIKAFTVYPINIFFLRPFTFFFQLDKNTIIQPTFQRVRAERFGWVEEVFVVHLVRPALTHAPPGPPEVVPVVPAPAPVNLLTSVCLHVVVVVLGYRPSATSAVVWVEAFVFWWKYNCYVLLWMSLCCKWKLDQHKHLLKSIF